MNSFLFPEDLHAAASQRVQEILLLVEETTQHVEATPSVPTRAPPPVPRKSLPPPPTYAPPPVPVAKEKQAISVTELSIPSSGQEIEQAKQARSYRRLPQLARLRSKRETKNEKSRVRVDAALPPLSPLVDEEFWRTGRYPSPTQAIGWAHVPF